MRTLRLSNILIVRILDKLWNRSNFDVMRFAFLIAVWWVMPLWGQETNPFEIASRIESDSSTEAVSLQDSIMGNRDNPFEVRLDAPVIKRATAKKNIQTSGKSRNLGIWGYLLSLVTLILFSIGIAINRSRFISILKSVVNSNYLKTLMRTARIGADFQFFLLYLLFFLNISTFLYFSFINNQFGAAEFIYSKWIWFFLVALSVYFLRHLVMWFIEFTFPVGSSVISYNYSVAFHNLVAGACLLPIVLGMQFGPESGLRIFFILGISIVALLYILRQSKGFLMAIGIRGFNPIYFFLYLCAIEIAPILVGLRILLRTVS